jgi:C1A family cysteine protease
VDIEVLDVSSIISILQSNRLPIVALRITDAFLEANGGVVERDGVGQDGHAIVAVGAAQLLSSEQVGTIQPGERLLCLRNSWGTNWGVNGHCLISEGALRECGLGIIGLQPIIV